MEWKPPAENGAGHVPVWYDARRVANARVLLVGAGSLGESVLIALGRKGFRRLLLVDPGTVGAGDIGRLPLAGPSDIGGFRAEVAAVNMGERAPGCVAAAHVGRIESLEGWNFEVVVGCTGDTGARLHANSHARRYRIPYVDATADGHRGKVQTVLPEGPCVECGMDRRLTRELDARASREPLARKCQADPAVISRVTDHVAAEVLKAACGMTDLCTRGAVYFDGTGEKPQIIWMRVDPKCPNHGDDIWGSRSRSSIPRTGTR